MRYENLFGGTLGDSYGMWEIMGQLWDIDRYRKFMEILGYALVILG